MTTSVHYCFCLISAHSRPTIPSIFVQCALALALQEGVNSPGFIRSITIPEFFERLDISKSRACSRFGYYCFWGLFSLEMFKDGVEIDFTSDQLDHA